MPAPSISLDTRGGNQLKPLLYHNSVHTSLHVMAFSQIFHFYDTNTPTPSHILHQDRRSSTIRYRLVVKKALCGAHITSRLVGIKNFLGSTALGHRVQEQRSFGTNYNFFFSYLGHQISIGRIRDIIPQGSKDSIRSNLQD